MKKISLILAGLTVFSLIMSLYGGLRAAHGLSLGFSHIEWGFIALGLVLLTVTLNLMFIFKQHSIIHRLMSVIDEFEGKSS